METVRAPPPVIELDGVRVRYGAVTALQIDRLRVGAGERVFVLGHSGSGKTTLSRLLKGRLRPGEGRVRVLGEDPAVESRRQRRRVQRRVAMIDQDFFLVPGLSVVTNVLTGALGRVSPVRGLLGWYSQEEWAQAEAILREVGLEGLGERRADTLSGGQRQRAAIARALMQGGEVVVADEPTSSLDPELAGDVLELLVQATARRGWTLIANLHQPELARRFASRFLALADGRPVYDGAPEGFTPELARRVYRGAETAPSNPELGDSDDPAATALAAALSDPPRRLAGG